MLDNLERLILRPVSREAGAGSVLGWEQSAAELDELRRRIEHRPFAWVAQEALAMASAPTLTPTGLESRRSVLRAFAVARRDSYVVMPGGLTRVAPNRGNSRISNQDGAIAKDTWVLASEPERLTGFWLQSGPAVEGIDPMSSIPSQGPTPASSATDRRSDWTRPSASCSTSLSTTSARAPWRTRCGR